MGLMLTVIVSVDFEYAWDVLLRSHTMTFAEFCQQSSFTTDSVGMRSFHDMLEITNRQEECSGSYSERFGLRASLRS